jgi:hypothetical protein
MMGVSSGVLRASIIKAMNDDDEVDNDVAGEILLEALVFGCLFLWDAVICALCIP